MISIWFLKINKQIKIKHSKDSSSLLAVLCCYWTFTIFIRQGTFLHTACDYNKSVSSLKNKLIKIKLKNEWKINKFRCFQNLRYALWSKMPKNPYCWSVHALTLVIGFCFLINLSFPLYNTDGCFADPYPAILSTNCFDHWCHVYSANVILKGFLYLLV